MAAEPQLGAEEESLRKEEPSSLEAVSREERSRAAAAERVAMGERRERERENGERGSMPLTRCCIQSCHARESQSRGRGSREQHKRQSVWESLLGGCSRGRGSGVGAGAHSRDESK
jgi:hypothetical protein